MNNTREQTSQEEAHYVQAANLAGKSWILRIFVLFLNIEIDCNADMDGRNQPYLENMLGNIPLKVLWRAEIM